jgi:8-oxo-dGTP diphosphatase
LETDLPVIAAVSVAARIGGKWLLVQRGREPSKGKYAFPGGRAETAEALEDAARRELFEETGLRAGQLAVMAQLRLPGAGCIYALTVFSADTLSGTVSAGDDAVAAAFFTLEEIGGLPMSASTLEAILKFEAG